MVGGVMVMVRVDGWWMPAHGLEDGEISLVRVWTGIYGGSMMVGGPTDGRPEEERDRWHGYCE